MQFPSGLLNLDGSPTPALMDAIRHSETGHLNDAQAVGAVSKKDAIGPYQLLRKNLHQMGYKMPTNISEADATGIDTSRALAAKYVKGYNQHHNFTNPLHSLAAFNMGPTAAARWIEDGADFDKLPQETKEYVTRASVFLNQGQNDMMPNQSGALSTNKTAMLHPDLQADVAKMRNNQVPENVISDYISQRSQYYDSLAPAPTPQAALTQGNAVAPAAALTAPDDSFMSPDDDMLSAGQIPMFGNDNPDATLAKVGADIKQALMGKDRNQRAAELARQQAMSAEIDNAPDPVELPNTTLADDDSIPPALSDQAMLAMDAARNQQDTFTSGSLGEQAQADNKLDNTSKRPDAALLKEANDQLGDINASAGRRNAAILSTTPTQAIGNVGMRPNDMIRIGGAMVRGSAQGGLEAIGAATEEFGNIEDRDLTASGALQRALASGKGKGKDKDLPPPVIENPTVTSNIDALIPQLDEDLASWLPSNVAGFGGKILSNIAGSDAYDFNARIETIKANIGFDKLQAMRDASPTGGALGQVSEMELRQLNASMGNLDIGQSPEQLRENLIAVREQYIRTIRAIEAQRQAYRQMQGGGGLTQNVQSLVDQYAS
jgi:hypothetical protein